MLIGARNGMLVKSGYTAKDYIQDGLVAMWDGIENAGWGVHDANAANWVDLSGCGNSITLHNISFSANHAVFNGSTSYGEAPANALAYNIITIETVYESTTTQYQILIYNYYLNGIIARCIGLAPLLSVYIGSIGNNGIAFNPRLSFSAKASRSFIYGAKGFISGYENMQALTASEDEWNYGVSGSGVKIGRRDNGIYFGGKVYTIRAYSRALTADEIAANYAVDKARFNLP